MTNPTRLPDQPVDLVEGALLATVAGRPSVAEAILGAISVADYAHMPRYPVVNATSKTDLVTATKRRNPTTREKADLYRRDGWTCRYCGARTVLTQVLYLLSAVYPRVFPVEVDHWSPPTHPLYWGYTSHCEHVVALAAGGSVLVDNLITACARCQYGKNATPLAQLGWAVVDAPSTSWDGLSAFLPQLYAIAPERERRRPMYLEWLDALGR